jgi:hypothetical protein
MQAASGRRALGRRGSGCARPPASISPSAPSASSSCPWWMSSAARNATCPTETPASPTCCRWAFPAMHPASPFAILSTFLGQDNQHSTVHAACGMQPCITALIGQHHGIMSITALHIIRLTNDDGVLLQHSTMFSSSCEAKSTERHVGCRIPWEATPRRSWWPTSAQPAPTWQRPSARCALLSALRASRTRRVHKVPSRLHERNILHSGQLTFSESCPDLKPYSTLGRDEMIEAHDVIPELSVFMYEAAGRCQ